MTIDDKKSPASRPLRPADVATSAREVAKHIDRRQVRRRVLLWLLLLVTIIFAIVYFRCGSGWGVGGRGKGDGDGPGSVKGLAVIDDAAPNQCELTLAPEGILLAGAKVSRDDAVAACKAAGRAMVIVTGNTVQADWDALKAALEAAKVTVFRREVGTSSGSAGSGSAVN
jgi:hypothetical protein